MLIPNADLSRALAALSARVKALEGAIAAHSLRRSETGAEDSYGLRPTDEVRANATIKPKTSLAFMDCSSSLDDAAGGGMAIQGCAGA